MVAACLQGLLLNAFFASTTTECFQIAGEVPEAGTILLLGVGALILKNKKNKK
jgi:hypothetical protein